MSENQTLTIKETFDLATKNHQENNLDVAENLYNKIIRIDPDHLDSLNNLGLLFHLRQEHIKAVNFFEKVIELNPNYITALSNLGVVLLAMGEHQKAINYFSKAIEIKPDHAESLNNLGAVYNKIDDYEKAITYYNKVLKIDPNNADTLNNIGLAYKKKGEDQKAINSFKKAIEINPSLKQTHNTLGTIWFALGESQKAIDCYERAIEIDPKLVSAHVNISGAFISELNNFEKAIKYSHETLKLSQELSTFHNKGKGIDQKSVSLFRLKHDVQQAKYLSSKNYNVEGIDEFQKVGDEILNREENNSDKMISLNSNEVNSLLPFYKATHIYKPKSISGRCINPNKNWLEVEEQYLNSSNQIMYIDDFLSEEALVELREFCLVSKVWHREYKNKYLGAFSNVGFISPIHLQIATDLKQKLPKLFGPHKLGQFWGFKYDSTLGKGINIHADFAFHNLNFWVTPDEYNNNKNSGGLKVYDVSAPDQWTFSDYNTNQDKIYKFLEDNNAKCTNVTYKCNRAVLFNSAYFHETDEIDFKDEYEGRRINNTYLFGNRLVKPQIKS